MALAAAGCMGFTTFSITPAWVRNALTLGRSDQLHNIPTSARFTVDEGGRFILDRTHHPALLKFDDSPEVWSVTPSRGPRGDILFKDDVGDILIRVTKLGGVTVFTSRRPAGSAATLLGRVAPLSFAPIGPTVLYQRMILASSRCSRATHHLVAFDAPDADAKSAGILFDTAWLAMDAIVSMSSHPSGRAAALRVDKVVLTMAGKPGVWLRRGVLTIAVNPGDALSGHPSSARIAQAIEGE
ncbi:MAG: DUF4908 domain-containing protein [Caulobacteraceae bacterium]